MKDRSREEAGWVGGSQRDAHGWYVTAASLTSSSPVPTAHQKLDALESANV
jgi:hypothetical protein